MATRPTSPSTTSRRTVDPNSPASIRARKAAATRRRNAAAKAAAANADEATTTAATKATDAAADGKVGVQQVQQLAERAMLMQVGAGLTARDNLVSTVKGIADPASVQKQLADYEKRGAKARNRFERQVRTTRNKLEHDLRQRRTTLEQTVTRGRTRVQDDLRSARTDIGRQSGSLGARVEKLVTEAQRRGRIRR